MGTVRKRALYNKGLWEWQEDSCIKDSSKQ